MVATSLKPEIKPFFLKKKQIIFYRGIQETASGVTHLVKSRKFLRDCSALCTLLFFYYMTTFIHYYEKTFPTWAQQIKIKDWYCRKIHFSIMFSDKGTSINVYVHICKCVKGVTIRGFTTRDST